MTLALLVVVPAAGGLAAWVLGGVRPSIPRWVSLLANLAMLALAALLWARAGSLADLAAGGWIAEARWAWIRTLGISFALGADGFSLSLVTLSAFLGAMAVLSSWNARPVRPGFFHFALMLAIAGVIGVFLAVDLVLFVFFWELMIVPMFFLIDLWGGERRHPAAVKFFLFTQAGGLMMLLSVLGLAFAHARSTGTLTFDSRALAGTPLGPAAGMLLLLGFLAAFAVKLPVFPLHAWLPDAYAEAPLAGNIVLAGLMSKTAAYGLIRFALPLFPDAARIAAPAATALALAGILYGGLMAFGQTDVKRLAAYSSISHLGFILLGIFAFNATALAGASFLMIAHGVSTAAVFMLAGWLEEKLGTRETTAMGGLWRSAPRMGTFAVVFAMAMLGLPGLGVFVGEFMVVLGTWQARAAAAVLASLGAVVATVYALAFVQRVFHGSPAAGMTCTDLSARQTAILALMAAILVSLGLFPQPVLGALAGAWQGLLAAVGALG